MSSNISNDSPFFVFMSKVGDYIYLNVLFILFSLPIITIGASISATYVTMKSLSNHEEKYIFRTFWKAFKRDFKSSTILWIIIAICGLGMAVYSSYIGHHVKQIVALCIYMLVLMVFLFISVYVFALQATFTNTTFAYIKNALLTAIGRLPYTVGLVFITFLPPFLTLFLPQYVFFTATFWVLIGFSLISRIRVALLKKALAPYLPEEKPVEDHFSIPVDEGSAIDESKAADQDK